MTAESSEVIVPRDKSGDGMQWIFKPMAGDNGVHGWWEGKHDPDVRINPSMASGADNAYIAVRPSDGTGWQKSPLTGDTYMALTSSDRKTADAAVAAMPAQARVAVSPAPAVATPPAAADPRNTHHVNLSGFKRGDDRIITREQQKVIDRQAELAARQLKAAGRGATIDITRIGGSTDAAAYSHERPGHNNMSLATHRGDAYRNAFIASLKNHGVPENQITDTGGYRDAPTHVATAHKGREASVARGATMTYQIKPH